jgi:lipopolysaccharide transport system ATP-binding protein
MSATAISVENLAKSYRIGKSEARHPTLLGDRAKGSQLFWALRDISFVVPEGQAVGFIGHNGAGKSTLLKILARITAPTRGRVRVRGRMASLLEVGTGFHPDLTGRENVHMNAAVLGMSRSEIRRRFDAIVDFSGVEQFIDTPIKHYSSGMKVRLGFAVAAHLEPEILVIDEVLAVGDAEFQRKCLSRIEDVEASGRTVLFVSHNLAAVARLCSRALVLHHGRVTFDGKALEGVHFYTEQLDIAKAVRHWSPGTEPGDDYARLRYVEVLAGGVPVSGPSDVRRPLTLQMRYEVLKGGHAITPSVHVMNQSGEWLFASIDVDPAWHARPRAAGVYESRTVIPGNLLNEGTYGIGVALATLEPYRSHCFARDCVGVTIFDAMEGDTARGRYLGEIPGGLRPLLQWSTERVSS